MAKVLKVAAIAVGAVALAATGIGAVALGGLAGSLTVAGLSTSTLLLASSGLALASNLLTKRPGVTASQTDRLTVSIDPRAYRKTVYGSTAMASDLRYQEWFGKDQERCGWVICNASHAIEGMDQIWFADELAWSAAGGVTAKFHGYLTVRVVTEGGPGVGFSFGSGRWNASARLTGCAWTYLEFKVTGNSKKAESPFSSSLPSRLTFIGRGARLYDPRRDSTVPGGSGSMRVDDQLTWRFVTDDGATIGENLALQILHRQIGWRIRNPQSGALKLAVGAGVPARRIDMASYLVAANLCDEPVNRAAGGTEPRYAGACVVSEGDDQKTVLDMLCAACNGRFRDTTGKLGLAIMHNDLAGAAADEGLNDDDVVGAWTWRPDPSLDDAPNIARGRYVDPSTASLYQMVDYPEVGFASPDGMDRYLPLDMGCVESPSQAQRIAKQALTRKQYPGTFSAPFDIRSWKYVVGDVVPFTFAPLSFSRKLFRVQACEPGNNQVCDVVLQVESEAIYAWDKGDSAPVVAADPIVYDSANNPLVRAIDDAGKSADWDGVTGAGKPADNATNSGDPDSPFGAGTVGEALATLDRIEPIEIDVSALQEAKVGTDAALQALVGISADTVAVQRQAQRDVGRLEEALLRAVMESSRTRDVLRDAGFVVDPTGIVRLYALEELADRTAQAEQTLDGQKALIASKASVTQVQDLIAMAVLDPSQVAELEPLIARLTSAESEIDGLNAQVRLKADLIELTRLAGTVSTVSTTLDAVRNAVETKAERTDVDQLGIRVGSAEQTLAAMPNTSSFSIRLRQAELSDDKAATGNLMALLGADAANQRQIVAVAEARQALTARVDDGLLAESRARLVLTGQIGQAQADLIEQKSVSVAADKALGERIDAVGITQGDQAAAIGRLDQAVIENGKGTAGATMTIRQQARAIDDSGEALLTSLLAGDQTGQRLAAQLVQIQTEFTTTLVANEAASAVARQALLARMGAAEAANVTIATALADTTKALTTRLVALESAFSDAATGLVATRARIMSLEEAFATEKAASVKRTDAIIAELHDPLTGLPATVASVAANKQAQIDGDKASAEAVEQVTARLDGFGGVGIEQSFAAIVDRTGKIEARYAIVIDANGNLAGFQLIGSDKGPASFNLINTDLRMGTGRVVFNNGSFMQVQGVGFGASQELLEWFGPTMAIEQCSRSNAVAYKTINGDAYFGGSLSAGALKNAVSTSLQTPDASVATGPFLSRGRPRRVVISYSWSHIRRTSSGGGASGSSAARIVLLRTGASQPLATLDVTGHVEADPAVNGEPGTVSETMSGSLTFTDTAGGAEADYTVSIASRTTASFSGTASKADEIRQLLGLVSTEE